MGINYNPRIVTDGLVLALDAGNIKSYPGSGTTWGDLSGNGNVGIMTNGPVYSSMNGGTIVFDGNNDNVSIGTNGFSFGSSPGTLSAWAKSAGLSFSRTIFSYGNAETNGARFLGIGQNNFYFSGYGSSISASGLSYDSWFNLVGVYDGTNASMYVNGALVAGPTDRSSWNTVASNAGIGKNVSNNEYWSGSIAQVSVYNRALSAAEIQQNYNALKSRYATYISDEYFGEEVPNPEHWVVSFGSDVQTTRPRSVDIDSVGNVYITGYVYISGSGGDFNVIVAKFDKYGTFQWSKILGIVGFSEIGNGIAIDSNDKVYVTGRNSNTGSGYDLIVIKLDGNGNLEWQRALDVDIPPPVDDAYYETTNTDVGNAIAIDSENNICITGNGGSDALIVVKYSDAGTLLWKRSLAGQLSGSESNYISGYPGFGKGIAIDSQNNIYVTGSIYPSEIANIIVAKYNSSGVIQWQRNLSSATIGNMGTGICIDNTDKVYIVATSTTGRGTITMAKYDSSGVIQWKKNLKYTTDSSIVGNAISIDSSRNFYVVGYSFSSEWQTSIVKYYQNGELLWQRGLDYPSSRSRDGYGVVVDNFGNVHLCGIQLVAGSAPTRGLLAKLSVNGTPGTYGPWFYGEIYAVSEVSDLVDAQSNYSEHEAYLSELSVGLTLTDGSGFTSLRYSPLT